MWIRATIAITPMGRAPGFIDTNPLTAMKWSSEDSLCVVTGASSGIGRSLCKLLIENGATVVPVARRQERLVELESIAPERVHAIVGDITEPDVREKIARRCDAVSGGSLDLLVNNAGIGAIGRFADASESRMRRIMEVNFFAPVELTRGLLPRLRRGRQSVICNVGSVLGHRAVPDKSEYCASKFAIHGWSDSLRAELASDGIQVTLVSPSTTRSEFFDSLVETEDGKQSKSLGSWPADRVASACLSAICSRKSEVILSLGGKALVYGDRLSPPLMNWVLRQRD